MKIPIFQKHAKLQNHSGKKLFPDIDLSIEVKEKDFLQLYRKQAGGP